MVMDDDDDDGDDGDGEGWLGAAYKSCCMGPLGEG
jgi:hypothetical protein